MKSLIAYYNASGTTENVEKNWLEQLGRII